MTPKDKAKELVEKFLEIDGYTPNAQASALICVEELKNSSTYISNVKSGSIKNEETWDFWDEVEQELKKL